MAIDYRNEDFLARVRELTGDGVDVVARRVRRRDVAALVPRAAARRKACRVTAARTRIAHGRKNWPGGDRVVRGDRDRLRCGACSRPAGGCSPTGSRSCATKRERDPERRRGARTRSGSGRTSARCSSCFVRARSTRSWPSACRCPTRVARTSCSRARRRRESSCSCRSRRGRS